MTDPFLDEAQRQREHEQKLAEIKRKTAADARPWKYGIGIGVLILLFLVSLIGGLVLNAEHSRAQHNRDMQYQNQIARQCIEAGNIWINNSCLLAHKN